MVSGDEGLITTSSVELGTPDGLQLAAVSQSPPLGPTQVTVDRTTRSSRPSKIGRSPFERLRTARLRSREGIESFEVIPRNGSW